MTQGPQLVEIWRHPIKALSREPMATADLRPGATLEWDRHWAVTHAASRFDGRWAHKMNFLRGVTGPSLMAVTAELQGERLTLHHPERPPLTLTPDDPAETEGFLAWLTPLWPEDKPAPTGLVAADQALTDVPEPWLAVMNLSSHRAVAQRLGDPDLSLHRWRSNLCLDGLAPWEEFDWIDRQIQIGRAVLHVRERITRCKATMANPATGRRDHDTLAALGTWGHQDFGVYAEVIEAGAIAPGDAVTLLPS